MANTLTGLIPSLYAGLDTVSREMIGFIPAVGRDANANRAAVGQTVTYHIAPPGNGVNVTPAMAIPEPTDQTIGNNNITITKARAYEFGFVGEEQLGLNNNGAGYNPVQADMFAQAVRGLANEIEVDLGAAAKLGASRAVGNAGVLPFSTNTRDISYLRKVLIDNGAPISDLQLVLDTTAGAELRTLYGINTDRDWSNVPMAQQGVLVTPHGMSVRESGQMPGSFTAGDAAGATTNSAGYAVGATTITLASAGTGAILAGDFVTFAGDDEMYQVVTGDAAVGGGGTIVLQEPGLRQAIPASTAAITVVVPGTSPPGTAWDTGGVAFHRNAIVLASRPPALPQEGDMAIDSMMMVDPRSGLVFEVRVYPGYRKVRFEVAMAWGVKVTQPRHSALLLR